MAGSRISKRRIVRRSCEFGCMFVRSGKERVARKKASPADGSGTEFKA